MTQMTHILNAFPRILLQTMMIWYIMLVEGGYNLLLEKKYFKKNIAF